MSAALHTLPWFVIWILLAAAAFWLEGVFYFLLVGRYYRLGPALKQQVWMTNVSIDVARDALEWELNAQKFVWRRRQLGQIVSYCVRKGDGKQRASMWPRFLFRIEEDAKTGTANITSEVRPFLSLLLFIPPWFFMPGLSQTVAAIYMAMFAAVCIGYWAWELRLPELRRIRSNLTCIGVHICDRCGYDIRSTPGRCPECGHSASTAA